MSVVDHPTTWYEDIVDTIGKFRAVIPECVRKELLGISAGQGRRSRTAWVALDIAGEFDALPCGGAAVDDEIISLALSNGASIATADSGLARTANAAHVMTITLSRGRVSIR